MASWTWCARSMPTGSTSTCRRATTRAGRKMSKVRVLYVDDNPHDRALVRDALEHEHGGFELTEASSRADFERQLAAGGWDLVLSDFNILGYTGLPVID